MPILRLFLLSAVSLLSATLGGAWAQQKSGAPDAGYNHGLLWKIEAPGKTPSYLFGTMHSDDPRVTTLAPPVHKAFQQAASFTMEVLTNGPGLVSMAEAMFFSDGQTLEQALGKELYAQTLQALSKRGLPTTGVEKQKPWVVMMALGMPRSRGGLALDLALQMEATRQEKPTFGLETMQEQIAVFNDLPLPEQVNLLRETLRNVAMVDTQLEEITHAYIKRDLGQLMAITEKYQPAGDRTYEKLMDRLLDQRNRRMLERMRPRLQEGGAFIAVGALHLPGPQGLLRLLEQAGYRVSMVY